MAGINVTATVGTFLLICVKQLMHSINNNYLSQEASQNPEPESPTSKEEALSRAQLQRQCCNIVSNTKDNVHFMTSHPHM